MERLTREALHTCLETCHVPLRNIREPITRRRERDRRVELEGC